MPKELCSKQARVRIIPTLLVRRGFLCQREVLQPGGGATGNESVSIGSLLGGGRLRDGRKEGDGGDRIEAERRLHAGGEV